ncbi:MAG: BPSS1780 family membrane protein [Rhodocyclaceae bacterium]
MQALRLPAASGWRWIAEGFRLYRRNPSLLILLALNYWLLFLLVFLVPYVGSLAANIVLQALSVTVMNGCRSIDRSTPVAMDIVWSGFKRNLPNLLRLGALYLLGEILIALVLVLGFGASLNEVLGVAATKGERPPDGEALPPFLFAALGLTVPLILTFWFAPMLVAWHDIGAIKAVFFSAVAVLRNWIAFAVYGASAVLVSSLVPSVFGLLGNGSGAMATVSMLAALMFLAFVLMPTLFASIYVSYREVFAPSVENDRAT